MSNCGLMTSFPFRLTYPYLPFTATGKRFSRVSAALTSTRRKTRRPKKTRGTIGVHTDLFGFRAILFILVQDSPAKLAAEVLQELLDTFIRYGPVVAG